MWPVALFVICLVFSTGVGDVFGDGMWLWRLGVREFPLATPPYAQSSEQLRPWEANF